MLSVFSRAIRVRENLGGVSMKSALIVPAFALVLGLAACTNPYDPGQRALGGAAIGAAAAGGTCAATDALVDGAVGTVAGVATTPAAPVYGYPPPRRYVAETACGPGRHWIRSHHD